MLHDDEAGGRGGLLRAAGLLDHEKPLVTSTVVGAGIWFVMRPAEPVPPRVSRLQVPSSGTATLSINGLDRDLAITPDGSRVVYVGNRGTQLFVRALDALSPWRCSRARREGCSSPPMANGSGSGSPPLFST